MRLHWSFDYSHHSPSGNFQRQMLDILGRFYADQDRPAATDSTFREFAILPNFWGGYKAPHPREGNGQDLVIGKAIVASRKENGNTLRYDVRYENTTSGENLSLRFQCRDDEYRSLTGEWQIRSAGSADGDYSVFECSGKIVRENGARVIRLRTGGGLAFTAGSLPDKTPLTCNWALFDVISGMHAKTEFPHRPFKLAVLEDLEKLKPDTRLGRLGKTKVRPCDFDVHLEGYYSHGTGNPPSYWWLDGQGRTALMATTFATFVLTTSANTREH